MPIFDQGYQHWEGKLSGHAWRWLAIARRGVKTQLKNRWTRFALILAWLPALGLGTFLAFWGLLEQKTSDFAWLFRFLPAPVLVKPEAYRGPIWTLAFSLFLYFETYASMILVMVVGPNLISQDLRFNAIPLYFSRPLSRFDYFVGKLAVIGTFLGAVMVLPALLSYLLGVGFSLSFGVVADTYRILPGCLIYGAVVVVVAGLLMLAISSLSKNSRYVGAVWVGLWMVGDFSAHILGDPHLMAMRWGPIVSFTDDLLRVREVLLDTDGAWKPLGEAYAQVMNSFSGPFGGFRGTQPEPPNPYAQDFPWTWSAYVLAGLSGLSLWILTTRVRSLDRLR